MRLKERKERVIVKERGREKVGQAQRALLKTTKRLSKKEFRSSRLLT
jgi:hypothetical protein